MTDTERRNMKREMRFKEGLKRIKAELETNTMFEDYILGHISSKIKDELVDAMWDSDEADLIDALVSICIHEMEKTTAPTNMEIVKKLLEVEDEVNCLKLQNKQLSEQLKVNEGALKMLRANNVQRALVQHGKRISYKEEIQPMDVLKLLQENMPIAQIAEHFEVSRGLIYRRIEKLKEAGLM